MGMYDGQTCAIDGCEAPPRARGLCNRHYQRWWNNGNATAIKNNRGRPAIDRFMEKVDQSGTCWLWLGTVNRKGYGMFWPDAKGTPAHRWSYQHFVGPIPEGKQLDHLCRIRHCVKPSHLEPVTAKENQARSPFDPAARTHCPQGHEYTPENTYVNPSRGSRTCKTCRAICQAAYVERQRSSDR